jgi:RNA polymerase sigma-70 factor (ECF subfamily)
MDGEALFRSYAMFVASFLRKIGVDPSDIEDLVQKVFLTVVAKGGYRSGAAHPRTWLCSIAVRVASDYRRAKRRSPIELNDETVANSRFQGPSVDNAMEAARDLRILSRALDELDFAHRVTFVLFEIEGEPAKSIATILDVPEGTVHRRVHVARRRLLDIYEKMKKAGAR